MNVPRRLVASALSGALLVGALAGCSTGSGSGDGVSVVTSVYPLQFLAERIGGDRVNVTNLTSPGREPHDLELSVRQTAELTDADLVLYARGFQPAVDEAVDSQQPDASVDALAALQKAADSGRPDLAPIPDDPHFWLDPRAMGVVADDVTAQLIEIDPDHAEAYRQNAAALEADLVALDGRTSVALDDCERRTVVTTHQAFGYFARRYALDFVSISGLSPDAEVSPAHLVDLRRLVVAEGITTVFTETLASASVAHTLAQDAGVSTAVLDTIEGLTDLTADEDYLSLMTQDTDALAKANGCTRRST